MLRILLWGILFSLIPAVSGAEEAKPWKTTAKATYYLDTREYNTANLLSSTTGLPLGLTVWGFIDLHSNQSDGSERFDLTRYFMEYRLQRAVDKDWIWGVGGFGLEAEYNESAGPGNEVVRVGLTYQHEIRLRPERTGASCVGASTPMRRTTAASR